MLKIHQNIKNKLKYFHEIHKIPNIIFYGTSGSGKKTIVFDFINLIYDNDKEKIKKNIIVIKCSHMKGIKLIREELKFFAKTHINSNEGDIFKTIVLLNADKLTIDAQSALRRLIEIFSHNTRFFIVIEDKYKLLKPIISRFCEIYVPEPLLNKKQINLNKNILSKNTKMFDKKYNTNIEWLKKELDKNSNSFKNHNYLTNFVEKLYNKGCSGLDLIYILENTNFFENITNFKKYEFLIVFNNVKKEIKNEKLLMFFILHFIYLDTTTELDKLSIL